MSASDIDSVLKHAKKLFDHIRNQYEKALIDKEISGELQCSIKDFLSNVRSPLDYIIRDVMKKCGMNPKNSIKFPICKSNGDFYNSVLKDIKSINLPLFEYVESVQPYHAQNEWFGQFNELNNNYKHRKLMPQVMMDQNFIYSSGQNASTVMIIAHKITIGVGASINGAVFDGQKFNAPEGVFIDHIKWSDFFFHGIDTPALTFLEDSINGVERIISEINNYICTGEDYRPNTLPK